ncbi:guanosine nucleotide diphosphate dissociation inhibitor At5g09550-like [Magnolia sinica]|uniref:guanosine nucleotide diphosphate dissociation inhibitor At5g09550-like n=1 Tax=Magnolia sinica TaxID=86752 RepID=UPI00265A699D|nr:guanosine nucleotide diphosphate dissociation inhibitor At5g09550-like [Magnolia sinica]
MNQAASFEYMNPQLVWNDSRLSFMMANGTLVQVLIHTDVTKYLSFKVVDRGYVFNKGKVHKVLAADIEALKSPLMCLFEKCCPHKFFIYVQNYVENDPKTHEGLDLTRVTTRELIAHVPDLSLAYTKLFHIENTLL